MCKVNSSLYVHKLPAMRRENGGQSHWIPNTDVYVTDFKPMRHVLTGRNRRTLMKLVVDQPTQRVLGVHMLGDDVPEMMQGVAVALTAGATKQDFDRTIGIHPTSAEEFVTLRDKRVVSA